MLNFDDECGTLVKEGSWMFAGLRDKIKVHLCLYQLIERILCVYCIILIGLGI